MALKNRNTPLLNFATDMVDANNSQSDIAALILDFKALFEDLTDDQVIKHLAAIINDNGIISPVRMDRRQGFNEFINNYKKI